MYIRFVTLMADADSQESKGSFAAAYELRDSGFLPAHDGDRLQQLLAWFASNLQIPERFNRSRRPRRANKAISWFKPTALDHIAKAREIIAILEEHGVHDRMISTDQPGYIVFDDEFQVVAEPYASTDR